MDLLTSETRRVWIENHPEYGYAPGRVSESREDGTLLVVDDAGGQFQVAGANAQSVDPACLQGVEDLLMLGDFNEAALLHNIRVRYADDNIYTSIGFPILISINPYADLPLYGTEKQRQYRKAGAARAAGQEGGPPPHLYSVADAAYRTMLQERGNQSIIISGESGAGKTEATKRILAYMAEMQRSGFSADRGIEQQVLDANPVLESFGNAKTVRNDNSSRFGKFIEVEFDSGGQLLSAQISNYLLEKSRIVTQQPDERNYHVFYHVCAGVSSVPALQKRLKLGPAEDYEYTKGLDTIDGVDDSSEFTQVLDCMMSLGFNAEERDSILKIVAAVLHLGNMEFVKTERNGQDGVDIKDDAQAQLICELLSIEVEQLRAVLDHKTLEDPLTKKVIHMPHDLGSASHTRHSMAKVAFARLFDWLVWRINQSMSSNTKSKKDAQRIGLLDIYGFEVFEWNSFEQLCINFANEKLQQHFNTHMFTEEQKLYSKEGISWSHITFQDNQHIIDCIEKKHAGLFSLVDSECLMPGTSDQSLLGNIFKTFKNSKIIYKHGRFNTLDFAVAHYAGEVVYNTETFLEKNTDKLGADLVNLLKTSKMDLLRTLFTDPRFAPELAQKSGADSGKDKRLTRRRSSSGMPDVEQRQKSNVTLSMMFREQLDKLVEDLNKTSPRFVRCIKPNANKAPQEFDSTDVLRQLRCAGMLEAIRIRRAGYAVRRPFKEVFTRFRLLAPHLAASGGNPDYKSLCQKLAIAVDQRLEREGVVMPEKPWQMGTSRFFMKEELERQFERLLIDCARGYVVTLQRRWRGYAQKRRYQKMRAFAVSMQAALRTRQAVADFRVAKRRREAALEIKSALRTFVVRATFTRRRQAAISIQRYSRGWRCRSRIGKIKGKLAAEKVRKMREEEEKREQLQKAKEEAEARAREMEALKQQMLEASQAKEREAEERQQAREREEQERKQQEENKRQEEEMVKIQEENKRLQERLQNQKVEKEQQEASAMEELKRKIAQLEMTNSQLDETNRGLQDNLLVQKLEKEESDRKKDELEKTVREIREQPNKGMANTLPTGGNALESLRSELFSRIGDNTVDGHKLESALRPMKPSPKKKSSGEVQKLMNDRLEAMDEPSQTAANAGGEEGRRTILLQREMFEKMRRDFDQVQVGPAPAEEESEESKFVDITRENEEQKERLQHLEDEVRRLRRENAELKTKVLASQEDATEHSSEVASLVERASKAEAELQDAKFRFHDETSTMRQRLQENVATLQQQTTEMARLTRRAHEAESRNPSLAEDLRRATEENRVRQEQFKELEKGYMEVNNQLRVLQSERTAVQDQAEAAAGELDMTRRAARHGEQESQREQARLRTEVDRLSEENRAKENEIANVKRLLDDVMSAHAPKEELQKWKSKAEKLEQQYQMAVRYNQEMTSAVGHMTQAASERGGDFSELQQTHAQQKRDLDRREQELKMAELEKQDLQKQLDNVQSSCTYFQNKYKTTVAEMKTVQKEHQAALENVAQLSQQMNALRRQPGGAPQGQQKPMGDGQLKASMADSANMDYSDALRQQQLHRQQQQQQQLKQQQQLQQQQQQHQQQLQQQQQQQQRQHQQIQQQQQQQQQLQHQQLQQQLQQLQQQREQEAEDDHMTGRPSLLTQLNLSQRPGFR